MKWYYWLGGALILAVAVWYYFAEQKELADKMARVRDAKADKKNVSQNDNDDVFIRIESEKEHPAGDKQPA